MQPERNLKYFSLLEFRTGRKIHNPFLQSSFSVYIFNGRKRAFAVSHIKPRRLEGNITDCHENEIQGLYPSIKHNTDSHDKRIFSDGQ